MKTLLFAVAAVSLATTFAESNGANLSPEEQKAAHEKWLRRTGGRIIIPGSLKGEISCVNCQGAAKAEWIAEAIGYLKGESYFDVTLREGKFRLSDPEIKGDVTLFIVDDPALPPLLVAPDSRWAAVNAGRLRSEKEPFFAARVKKEIVRAFAFLCGAANSQFPDALTGPVTAVEDLDRFEDHRLPADIFQRCCTTMRRIGVTPAQILPYSAACKMGIAPQPTNDIQRAIWDKVHAPPEKPLKITYDKDKQKPVVK